MVEEECESRFVASAIGEWIITVGVFFNVEALLIIVNELEIGNTLFDLYNIIRFKGMVT